MREDQPVAPAIANRYIILDQLGQGSMGAVYHAKDQLTGEMVALKQMLTPAESLSFSTRDTKSSQDPRLELAHEFQMLASLRHPHIISVLDYGFTSAKGGAYFTMQLIDSPQTLTDAGMKRPLHHRIDLMIQLLQGLAYIHRRGLLHRDLKPNNVLVRDDHVYIADFGLATLHRGADETDEGNIAGTLAYMAPEVLAQSPLSPRSDLYAVGVMLYELLAGRHPYGDLSNPIALIHTVLNIDVDLSQLDIAPPLVEVLHRLLSKEPADRYQDADETIRAVCAATDRPLPAETHDIRESFLQAADFIGRENELRALRAALNEITAEGSAWLIGGESGVGKSRLINEVATRALIKGALVLRCQAASETTVNYGMWREAFKRLALANDLSDADASLLKLFVPTLDALLERPIAESSETDADHRLLMLVDTMIHHATAKQPILLILEDLHWAADAPNDMRLIEALIKLTAHTPLIVVGSYRDDERPDLPDRLGEAQTITLQRLTADEIRRLSVSMLGDPGHNPHVVQFLNQHTEGNVFFLIEVVRVLAEEAGRIADIGQVTLPSQIVASGVQRVVDYRLNRVPDWARPMIDHAAVAGRQIDAKLLSAIDPALDVEAWLDACVNLAVLDVQDGVYRFSHDKLREGVLSALPDEVGRDLHRRIAAAYETVYADDLDSYAGAIARHYGAAGDSAKESVYAVRAADYAYNLNNYRDADHFYRRAHALNAHTQFDEPARVEARIALGIGKVAYSLGDYPISEDWCQQAAERFRTLGDELGYADAINCIGEGLFRQSFNERARPLIVEAMAIRRRHNDMREVGYSLMNLGVIEAQIGNLKEAEKHFLECHAIMKQSGDPIALARSLNNLAIIYDMLHEDDKSRDYHEEALTIRRAINDRQGIGYSLLNLAQLVSRAEGDLDTAITMLEESVANLRIVGDRNALSSALAALGDQRFGKGQYEQALIPHQEAVALRQLIGNPYGISASLNSMARIMIDMDDTATARAYIRDALQTVTERDLTERIINDVMTFALILQAEANTAEALAIYAGLLPHLNEFQADERQRIDAQMAALREQLDAADIAADNARFSGWSLGDLAAYIIENATK